MAQNFTDDLTYFLSLPSSEKSALAGIRHWNNLKIASEGNKTWVTGFTALQIQDVLIQQLLNTQTYYAKEDKLYPLHSILPTQPIPNLLWTPIERALTLNLPQITENPTPITTLNIQLTAYEQEHPSCALLCEIEELGNYLNTALEVRLAPLSWIRLGKQVLILGTPLLPLPGQVFWETQHFLLPIGYHFEWHTLTETFAQMLNPTQNQWVIWTDTTTYSILPKTAFQPLSLSSYRLSTQHYG